MMFERKPDPAVGVAYILRQVSSARMNVEIAEPS